MTAADMVNLILEKFRTGKVEFLHIEDSEVSFTLGPQQYLFVAWRQNIEVYHRIDGMNATDSYSQWVEGVLNGKTRDENGVLS